MQFTVTFARTIVQRTQVTVTADSFEAAQRDAGTLAAFPEVIPDSFWKTTREAAQVVIIKVVPIKGNGSKPLTPT